MASDIARHHQLHGVQPVLPVPALADAVDWYRRVLGFELDFLHGEPAHYGRVKLGDRSWGDPIYIHLQLDAAGPIQPCGEVRLHVGHDIDGLHRHVLAQGAGVIAPPADQPWGLREMSLRAPGGHVLVLGAEVSAAGGQTRPMPRPVIACYRAKPGQDAALQALVRGHVPTLQRLGLATGRAPIAMRAADGTIVEVFEWASAAAIEAAHTNPDVQQMWSAFGNACAYLKLSQLAETQNLFAEFTPLDD
jgi:catechol 2,3-dioxygenase-like lactoylglutathione lyase family enzyme